MGHFTTNTEVLPQAIFVEALNQRYVIESAIGLNR